MLRPVLVMILGREQLIALDKEKGAKRKSNILACNKNTADIK